MRWLKLLPLALLGLVILVLLSTFVLYPPQYVMRGLTWGDADVKDYTRFPERALVPAGPTFHFTEAHDEARIQGIFQRDPAIKDLDAFLAETSTQAFLVIQHDRILYEKYFNGAQRDSMVTSFSVAKSFTSALIGIAIAEGRIASVDDPITRYLPELADRDPRFGQITVKHLLQMSSGIRYVEYPFVNGDNAKTYYYPNLRQLALEQTRITGAPSDRFLYNNYHPLLLGLILERSTGTSVTGYLQEKIWKPLGMEYTGSWSLDSEASGFEKMESGINARAIDFAKFGRLYLKGGNWDGVQIVPSEWVAESTREAEPKGERSSYYPAKPFFAELNGYYGYMWWGIPQENGAHDFVAIGNKGQYLYISPAKDLIILRHGAEYGVDFAEWGRILRDAAQAL